MAEGDAMAFYGVAVALKLVDKKVAPAEFKQIEFPIPVYHPGDLRRDHDMVIYEKVDRSAKQEPVLRR